MSIDYEDVPSTCTNRKEYISHVQHAVIEKIDEFLARNFIGVTDFAKEYGFKPGFINAIRNGERLLYRSERENIQKLADVLGLSFLQILVLSGYISCDDVLKSTDKESRFESIFKTILSDSEFCYILPKKNEWDQWPVSAKKSLYLAYLKLTQKSILS